MPGAPGGQAPSPGLRPASPAAGGYSGGGYGGERGYDRGGYGGSSGYASPGAPGGGGYGGDRSYSAYDQPTGRHERPGYQAEQPYRGDSYGPDPYTSQGNPEAGYQGYGQAPQQGGAHGYGEDYQGYGSRSSQGYQGGYQDQGYQGQGHQDQAYRGQGYEQSSYDGRGYGQDYQGQDYQGQGYQDQGYQDQGYQGQGYQGQGYGDAQGYPAQPPAGHGAPPEYPASRDPQDDYHESSRSRRDQPPRRLDWLD